jgi:hypothetical protein
MTDKPEGYADPIDYTDDASIHRLVQALRYRIAELEGQLKAALFVRNPDDWNGNSNVM